MPGYPIAKYTILREIALPLFSWFGCEIPEFSDVPVILGNTIQNSTGFEVFVLATIGKSRTTG